MNNALTKEDAAARLKGAAFVITVGYEDAGRAIVHTFRGTFGAFWDLDSALAYVEQAINVLWVQHPMRHDLKVQVPGESAVYFDVSRPA